MKSITVTKTDLMDKIRANRVEHIQKYEAAIEVYYERLAEWHVEQTATASRREDPERYPSLPKSENHANDYDEVLALLEWEIEDVVNLDREMFRQMVLDQWGWSDNFVATTRAYVG